MNLLWAATHYGSDTGSGSGESIRLAREGVLAAGHRMTLVVPGPFAHGQSERVFSSPRFVLHMAAEIVRCIKLERPDILHAQDRRMILPMAIAAAPSGIPWVVTLRDIGLCCPSGLEFMAPPDGMSPLGSLCSPVKVWRRCADEHRAAYHPEASKLATRAKMAVRAMLLALDRRLCRRAKRIICVSQALRKFYEDAKFPDGRPLCVVHSPVEGQEPVGAKSIGAPRVLFVGKPSRGKGWPTFEATAILHNSRAGFFHIGPRGSDEFVRFVHHQGPLSHAATMDWMRYAHIVMVPSLQVDALPRVALEAQANGAVVVGSSRGGIPEAVHGSGWYGRPDQIPRMVGQALDLGVKELIRLGEEARVRTINRFGLRPTTEALLKVYEGVCG